MPQNNPAELTRRQSLWLVTSTGLAGTAAVLAFVDLFWRYPSSTEGDVPLPGMDHVWGQVGWAALLGGAMFLAAWLVRRAIMARLQVAVILSLLIHLSLFLVSKHVSLNIALEQIAETAESSETDPEELTLPDHGGMESQETQPEWERPIQTPIPETEREARDRAPDQPDRRPPAEPEQQPRTKPREAELPEKKATQVVPEQTKAEIARQTPQQRPDLTKPVEVPKLDVSKPSNEPELNAAQDRSQRSTRPDIAAPQPADVRRPDRALQATQLESNRSEPMPKAASRQQVERSYRTAARPADLPAESLEPVAAGNAASISLQQRAMEITRLANAGLPDLARPPNDQAAVSRSHSASRVVPQAAAHSNAIDVAPSSGGSVSLARDPSAARGLSAAAPATESAPSVTGATGAAGIRLEPTASASAGTRGSRATVPVQNAYGAGISGSVGGAGGSRGASSPSGAAGIRVASVAGNNAGSRSPQLGNGPRMNSGQRYGGGRQLSAVGTSTEGAALPTNGTVGGGGSESGLLTGGPVGTSVARSAPGLPSGTGRGSSGGFGGSGSVGASSRGTGNIPGSLGSGLTGHSTGPSGRLDAPQGQGLGARHALSGRSAIVAGLSDADLQREQSGGLVMAGPQAGSSGGTGRIGFSDSSGVSVARRSAALPGGIGSSRTSGYGGRTSGGRLSAVTDGLSTGRDSTGRPAVETGELLAGILKRSTRGHVAEPQGGISPTFSLRKLEVRGEIAESMGGSKASESAVEAGLDWLARHQYPDGHWSIHEFQTQCKGHTCSGPGFFESDTAATGLSLLAYFGAAYTHQSGRHRATIDRGLRWLVDHQKSDGDLFHGDAKFVWLYSHGMASIALCEAYGMTKDPQLREPAQKCLDFIVASQHPQYGGWRYRPQFESDTSVSGWQVMALKSGEMAGLDVPSEAYAGVSRWLDSVKGKTIRGAYSYHPSREESLAMTAEGMLMRQYLGTPRNDPTLLAGGDYLRTHLPKLAERDAYYWYYATQVMFHLHGDYWDTWNRQLRDLLVSTQVKNGGAAGSWDPQHPTPEKWGAAGGRVYVTCLNILMLEVYYRHLPLYIELKK